MNRYFSIALSAVTAGAMGFAGAPTAHASCASLFGFGNSAQCTSSPTTIAIALGTGAEAHANGGLGAAVALGNGAVAGVYGWLGAATALGTNSLSTASTLGAAFAAGNNSKAGAGAPNEFFNVAIDVGASDAEAYGGPGNMAVNLFGTGSSVIALGTANMAFNTGNGNFVWAFGRLNSATALGGSNGAIKTDGSGIASAAFQVLGDSNIVYAGPGPLAISGSIFQNNAFITKTKPGIHINGFVAGGAAATSPPAATAGAKHTAAHGLAGSKRKHA
ncbi:hypothetical protein [Mycolicibacterium sp.]|uniref:hypothetical protein n=1 Tax=Mycolicibacterium sp. TaxID=2320850 RepID=UPI0037CADCF3